MAGLLVEKVEKCEEMDRLTIYLPARTKRAFKELKEDRYAIAKLVRETVVRIVDEAKALKDSGEV